MDTLRIQWRGHNGTTWDLLDPFSPVRLSSLAGLGMPSFSTQFSATGARDGRRYEGTVWAQSTLTITVLVGDEYPAQGFKHRRLGDDWRALDREFRKSLSSELTGKLIVTSGAGRRSMNLRLADPLEFPGRNPGEIGQAVYALSMTADDNPWWEGEIESVTYEWDDNSVPFYGGPDGDSLLEISPDNGTGAGTFISNPGDRPAWARWWARGPAASVSIGVDGAVTTLPFALAQGDVVRVDSDLQTITSDLGVNLWPRMGFADPTFAPIPVGEQVPLSFLLAGAADGSAVGLELTPLYEAPW